MSAPLGRIVDRHIKLIRYRNHPVVLANEKLSEPLLHLVVSEESESKQAKNRRSKSRKNGPRKQQKVVANVDSKSSSKESSSEQVCPECMSEDVGKKGPRGLRCNVCYHEWV